MRFFHGSMNELEPGTILVGRGTSYEEDWINTDFYSILEKYRPKDKIAHKEAVFLCHHPEHVDLAGGGTIYICEMQVQGKLQRHDMNWSSEISMLLDEDKVDWEKIKEAAHNYWNGIPHYNESVFEYLTEQAQVMSCYDFEDGFIDEDIPEVISDIEFNNFQKSLIIPSSHLKIKPR